MCHLLSVRFNLFLLRSLTFAMHYQYYLGQSCFRLWEDVHGSNFELCASVHVARVSMMYECSVRYVIVIRVYNQNTKVSERKR